MPDLAAPAGIPPKPPGGLPSPLTQGSPHMGPVTQQQGNQGNIASALMKVKNAIKMLEEALPLVPFGNDLHTEILKTATSLSKHMKMDEGNQGMEMSSLVNMAKGAAQSAPMAAMARMFNPGQGQPPATQQPPAAAA